MTVTRVAVPSSAGEPVVDLDGRPGLGYEPAIDGLRAVAVMVVMVYHGYLGWLGGGFLGVDLFFVVSGYLITTLLLLERTETGRVDLLGFWSRRARRLLPALFAVLAWVAVYAAWLADPGEVDRIRRDGLATLGHVGILSVTGADVVVSALPCMQPVDDPAFGPNIGLRTDPARVAALNEVVRVHLAERGDVGFVDPGRRFCPDGIYQAEIDGAPLHRDGIHYTAEGATLYWQCSLACGASDPEP